MISQLAINAITALEIAIIVKPITKRYFLFVFSAIGPMKLPNKAYGSWRATVIIATSRADPVNSYTKIPIASISSHRIVLARSPTAQTLLNLGSFNRLSGLLVLIKYFFKISK